MAHHEYFGPTGPGMVKVVAVATMLRVEAASLDARWPRVLDGICRIPALRDIRPFLDDLAACVVQCRAVSATGEPAHLVGTQQPDSRVCQTLSSSVGDDERAFGVAGGAAAVCLRCSGAVRWCGGGRPRRHLVMNRRDLAMGESNGRPTPLSTPYPQPG